ncbi:MAG: FxsA family protein [Candidatus Pelagibacter sp. TMED253]|nr:MAG: FxsA family protein [Candidatus Pelagibacter sp. TMED253]|tara:strand:+ start:19 stop:444 length:426 start_codon:yes stop_codon:yes gene_type:complete
MNSVFLLFIGVPALEVFLMIKIGGKIGALNTVSLIFLTAIIGIYFAKLEGIKTMRSGIANLYQNKAPIYEMITGASIAIAALLLIIPGFFTDTIGFLLLIPFTRKILISFFIKKNKVSSKQENTNILDGEIIEDKDKKDEL